ncbi:copper-transporting ATPase PAA1, chloroplastic-like [Neltuma alba]|uniref:copper-transporting ATPase PAA1, chloroplastic-like n=1 Tax=Neltuma alba TaxID=207710 RepID=UPI0010A340DD|nr:copper-transporting ATPase PAA1, chloroplastic-like [Prosopis alba]XP_028753098.1 copper-transporting ATPase PAA1, chloroplastic-like [Prosopis alba]
MALSISTLNHFASTQLKCFPSNFTILASSFSYLVPSSASSAFSPRRFSALAIPKRCRFRRVSAASAASGDDDSRRAGELSSLSPEVVVLNVEGMMCEGCADSVKKLLESRPQVSSASVNLTEKLATFWPAPEAKTESNWHNKLGGGLAEHLTNCGFKPSLQGQEDGD